MNKITGEKGNTMLINAEDGLIKKDLIKYDNSDVSDEIYDESL